MPRVICSKSPARHYQLSAIEEGFTLIEVLIAMLVLLIGLLGIAQMHFSSFQDNRNALYRNQATVIAEDLLDRVRGNPIALVSGGYNNVSFAAAGAAPSTVNCAVAAGCSAADIAVKDRHEWARNFVPAMSDYQASLPDGAGGAGIDATDSFGACDGNLKYDVTVSWLQPDGTRGSVSMSACL